MATLKPHIILFDLDGTLVLSTEAVEKTWEHYRDTRGFDLTDLYHKSHGARTVDTFLKHFPHVAPDGDYDSAAKEFDRSILDKFGHLALPIGGAVELLDQLNAIGDHRWAICTSGKPELAHGWFKKVLPVSEPEIFVTADDVVHGKPHPEPYNKGRDLLAAKLGILKPEVVVFEDAPAGIKAGVASGAVVVGIMSSFGEDVLKDAGASYVVKDLSEVSVSKDGDRLVITIKESK